MATRPLILPEPFTGKGSWDEWIAHFEDTAAVNSWDAEAKLLWLKVRLIGRARTVFQRLPQTGRASFEEAKKALRKRYEPESKRELYSAELQSRKKLRTEGWAEFVEDLKTLTERAYPDLQDEAKEQIALTHYLAQLTNSQVAFNVKQSRPKTIDDALTATLETEAYVQPARSTTVSVVDTDKDTDADAEVNISATNSDSSKGPPVLSMMKEILERMNRLEARFEQNEGRYDERSSPGNSRPRSGSGSSQYHRRQPIICRKCKKEGHYARGCAAPGNSGNYIETLGAAGQATEGDTNQASIISILPICPTKAYRIPATINCTTNSADGIMCSLLVDTGAAVSLIRKDIWDKVPCPKQSLAAWTGPELTGVEGARLHVHGTTCLNVELSEEMFSVSVLVVDHLTSEGILGL